MTTKNSNNGLKIGLIITIILLLAAGFFASKFYFEKEDTKKTLIEEKNQVINDLDEMVKQYDQAIAENEVVNQDLVDAKQRIQLLKDSLKASENSAKSLYAYKKRYAALQKEMDVLLKENTRLKSENKLLSNSLDSTQTQLNAGKQFADSLLTQNTKLANDVEKAATLQAVGLKGLGVIERSSGKQIPNERARRVDKIKVCFTIAKNSLVEAGDKALYIQVIDPKNNVLGENARTEINGKVLNYSLISKFNYINDNLDICEFIARNGKEKFEKGRYRINVFNDDELLSSSEFALR